MPVQVSTIYRDDMEVAAAKGGENLKLRLTGIDEEEMQPGFVICARHLPVPCVTHFGAQLQVPQRCRHRGLTLVYTLRAGVIPNIDVCLHYSVCRAAISMAACVVITVVISMCQMHLSRGC